MAIFAPRLTIGGNGGTGFSCYGADGKVLEKIGVWVGGWQIKALRIWRTGDEGQTFGNPGGGYREYAFEPGERITALSLWGNGAGTRLGAIRFTTSKGNTFDYGMTDWGRKQEYPVDVGSGVCVGLSGSAGSDIDSGCFVFLSPIAKAVLTDVAYPTLTFDTIGVSPVALQGFQDQNTGQRDRNWVFKGSKTVTTSQSWTLTAGVEAYAEASVEAGIPEVGKVSEKYGWKVSASASYTRSTQEALELSWEESGTLPPGGSIHLQALTRSGKLPSLDYEGRMVITLKSGDTFSYPVKGTYAGIAYTAVEVTDSETGKPLDAAPEPPAPKRLEIHNNAEILHEKSDALAL